MEFVITKGQLQLQPIPGEPLVTAAAEDGTPTEIEERRAGYLLRVIDTESGITFVISMAHENAAQLGATIVADTEAYKAADPPPPPIHVVPESALGALGHLGPGGVRREQS